jgi:dihydroneopterin aldolase
MTGIGRSGQANRKDSPAQSPIRSLLEKSGISSRNTTLCPSSQSVQADRGERGDCKVSDVILLEGIQIPAALGVTAAERRVRRPVTLDLEIGLDLREAGRVDRIGRTVHYKRIFEIVEDVAANQEHQLVEALGDRIARVVLSKFDVDFVTVTVRKPTPIAGVLQYAGVRITRTREDVS